MLEALPFPKTMKDVPKIAGGHHEKVDGTGYPMGLKAEEMPLTARAMAIADIFEALTSHDRPYKKAKTLTESLKIMSFMVKDKHIDKDLFNLFLTSGLYHKYAEAHLNPEQCDDVDINNYLS
jgi:HD-GYP domain-containing protein (c-di-GMP phosphodiesterase class II)